MSSNSPSVRTSTTLAVSPPNRFNCCCTYVDEREAGMKEGGGGTGQGRGGMLKYRYRRTF